MKKLILAFALFASMLAQAQKPALPLLQEITYPVRTLNAELFKHGSGQPSWHERLDPSAHYRLIVPILDRVRKGELTVYQPFYPYSTPMTKSQCDSVLNPVSQAIIWNELTYEESLVEVQEKTDHTNILGLEFHEDWYFDTLSNRMQKQVKGIVVLKFNPEDYNYNFLPALRLFYVPLNAVAGSEMVHEKNLVTSLITYDVSIMNMEEDTRETRWWEENLEPSKRHILRAATFLRAKQGKQDVYSAEYPYTRQLKGTELDTIFTQHDTLLLEDLETGNLIKTPFPSETDPASIRKIRFHEEWYFDHSRMAMHKSVKGIVLLEHLEGEHTNPFRELFYVPLNDYDPKELQKPAQVKVPRISYMLVANEAPGTVKGLDTARFLAQLNQIVTSVKNGSRNAYLPVSQSNVDPPPSDILPAAEWQKHFEGVDTLMVETENGPEYKTTAWTLPPAATRGVYFNESWQFDPDRYIFQKQVNSIDLVIERDLMGAKLYVSAFNVSLDQANEKVVGKNQFLLGKDIESDVPIWDFLADGTISYDSWWNNGLEPLKSIAIIQKILDDVSAGRVSAYDPVDRKKLDPAQAKERMVYTQESYDPAGAPFPELKPLTYLQVHALRFHEEWYFDTDNNMFMKKVKGVTFMTRDPVKEALQPVFYVKMKN